MYYNLLEINSRITDKYSGKSLKSFYDNTGKKGWLIWNQNNQKIGYYDPKQLFISQQKILGFNIDNRLTFERYPNSLQYTEDSPNFDKDDGTWDFTSRPYAQKNIGIFVRLSLGNRLSQGGLYFWYGPNSDNRLFSVYSTVYNSNLLVRASIGGNIFLDYTEPIDSARYSDSGADYFCYFFPTVDNKAGVALGRLDESSSSSIDSYIYKISNTDYYSDKELTHVWNGENSNTFYSRFSVIYYEE